MSKLLQSALLILVGIAIGLLAASVIDNILSVESGGGVIDVDTRTEDSAKLVMIDNATDFIDDAQQNNLEVFSYSYEISGEALLKVMNDNKVTSLCILNGLRDSNNIEPADRVFIIAPINDQGHVMPDGISYVSSDINTRPFRFFYTPSVLPEFNADGFHPFGETKSLFGNFEVYMNNHRGVDHMQMDSIKGFKITQNEINRLLPIDDSGKPRYDARARFSVYVNEEGDLVRGVTINSIELRTGNDIFSFPIMLLNDSRVCPNNCDFL